MNYHIKEIKYRIIYISITFIISFSIAYAYLGECLYIITKPLSSTTTNNQFLIYTNLSEAFITTIVLTIIIAFFLLLIPAIFYHVYYFMVPGLYAHEQKDFLKSINIILVTYILSIIITYIYFIPLIWEFFLLYDFGIDDDTFKLEYQGKIVEYINFTIRIFLSIILCFQIPIFFLIMLKAKVINNKFMINGRSWVIILSFILGALLSPPDIFSQIMMAIPLYIGYESTILISLFLDAKNSI